MNKTELKKLLQTMPNINYEYRDYILNAEFKFHYIEITMYQKDRVSYTFIYHLCPKFKILSDMTILSFKVSYYLDCETKEMATLGYYFRNHFNDMSFALSEKDLDENIKIVGEDILAFSKIMCEQ